MPIFHKHNFIESTNNKEMLYCSCGKTVSTHVHKWEVIREHKIIDRNITYGIIRVLKCTTCGELKKFEV